jgi:hypothetical protein
MLTVESAHERRALPTPAESTFHCLIEAPHHHVHRLLWPDLASSTRWKLGRTTASPQLEEPANAGAAPPNLRVSMAAA